MMRRRRLHAEPLETRLVPSTYYLHQGANLQRAIDGAHPGDFILLDAGATYMGTITLWAKANPLKLPLTIATNLFPLSPGVRVGPNDASAMAQILSPGFGLPAIQTQPGASFYTFRGLNILPINSSAQVDTLVTIGDGSSNQASAGYLPNNIILDQCFIHGWDGQGIKRGVGLNDGAPGSKTGVYNSYVSNFKLQGQDSQAIAGWNGPGPYTIQNNYLEAAGENVLFGGAYSYIQQVPSNITINNNTFSKLLSWKPSDPSFAGITYSVKNLLELKNAQFVTVDRNIFQNNWGGAQDGHAIVLTPRGNQSGGPWVTVSNVTFTHNIVQNTDQGFNILGSDDASTSQVTSNILIQDDIFSNLGYPTAGKNGQIFTLQVGLNGGTRNLIIDHVTINPGYTDLLVAGVHTGFQFTNSVMPQGTYGMIVSGLGPGTAALAKAFPDGIITGNVIVGGQALYYPPGNFFPTTWDQVSQYPSAGARGVSLGTGTGVTALVVSGFPSSVTAGVAANFSVAAKDGNGNVVTGYTGTIHFSSTNPQAVLPPDTVLSNGTGTFSATLKTAGTWSITATDTVNSSITGNQTGIVVNPGAASVLIVTGFPSPVGVGVAANFSVTAKDGCGNVATGYAGTVHFSSTDSQAMLPLDTVLSNGTGTFSATFKSAGTWSLTARDTVNASLTGSQTGIVVNGAAANVLLVVGFPSSITAGTAATFTVTAKDSHGNVVTGYTGTVHFSSTDPQAVLPPDGVLSNGTGTFSATLKTAGTWSITAKDTGNAALTGSQTGIVVSAAAATHFTIVGPSSVSNLSSFNITVKAMDAFGNIATGYRGTVNFSSSNSNDIPFLPSSYTFTGSDNGMHTFGLRVLGSGQHTISVFDFNNKNVQGSLATSAF
jgi:hypothetical protein